MIQILERGFNPPSVTAQQKGVRVVHGKPMFYTKSEVETAKREIAYRIKKYVPPEPITKPIKLCVRWDFHTADKKKANKLKYTRGDLDNLNKLLQDVMTDLRFWKDDSQIVILNASKYWQYDLNVCGIYIRIEEIDD